MRHQRFFSFILVTFIISLSTLTVSIENTSSPPTFFWSNYDALQEGRSQVPFQNGANIIDKLSLSEVPELLIVFVENSRPEIFSQNLKELSKLKNLVFDSQSSFVIQYTYGDRITSLISGFRQIVTGKTYLIQPQEIRLNCLKDISTHALGLEEFFTIIRGNWEAKSNGKTDLVVISLSSDQELKLHDNYFQQVSEALQDVKYIAAVVLNESPVFSMELHNEDLKQFERVFVQQVDTGTVFPIFMVEAVVVILILIFILSIGVWCTFHLQSELKYDLEAKQAKNRSS
jgi:hypothetical protein